MNICINKTRKGVDIFLRNEKFSLEYPVKIWNNFPDEMKDFFLDNYLFLKSVHLPIMLDVNKVVLNTSSPLLKTLFLTMQFMDIPNFSDYQGIEPEKYFKRFFNASFEFSDHEVKYPRLELNPNENSSVLSFSFGKESLLSAAISQEIGLDVHPVWTEESGAPVENEYKKKLMQKFNKEFKIKIEHLVNETMLLHKFDQFGITTKGKYSISHVLTEYAFLLLPFIYNYRTKYIFLGNEQSCNIPYVNKDGYKCYPVFDQSSDWTKELNNMIKIIFGNKFHLGSLPESLHELAVIKILHKRYTQFAKYQYSCFPDESRAIKNKRWCCCCSKCARMYIFLKAFNIDVDKLGFKEDMLSKTHINQYSIFKTRDHESIYDASGVGRDEQLLAFYLAYKNGVKGDLIEIFEKKFLNEAKEREDELIKEFLTVHDSFTLPEKIKQKIIPIFKEELINFFE